MGFRSDPGGTRRRPCLIRPDQAVTTPLRQNAAPRDQQRHDGRHQPERPENRQGGAVATGAVERDRQQQRSTARADHIDGEGQPVDAAEHRGREVTSRQEGDEVDFSADRCPEQECREIEGDPAAIAEQQQGDGGQDRDGRDDDGGRGRGREPSRCRHGRAGSRGRSTPPAVPPLRA